MVSNADATPKISVEDCPKAAIFPAFLRLPLRIEMLRMNIALPKPFAHMLDSKKRSNGTKAPDKAHNIHG